MSDKEGDSKLFTEFMKRMETKFNKEAKKYKGSWKHCELQKLRTSLKEHVIKWNHFINKDSQEIEDLIDIANYCMMIVHRLENELKIKNEEKEFHTWDGWCLLKLKELGRTTQKQWAEAMGCKFAASINRIIKNNIDKLIITIPRSGRRKFYELKKDVEL